MRDHTFLTQKHNSSDEKNAAIKQAMQLERMLNDKPKITSMQLLREMGYVSLFVVLQNK